MVDERYYHEYFINKIWACCVFSTIVGTALAISVSVLLANMSNDRARAAIAHDESMKAVWDKQPLVK
jgi:hypothetical protein